MNTFGLSAPAEKIYEHFGFGPDNLTARARDVIAFYTPAGKPPWDASVLCCCRLFL
jgi:hypothetical protein